MLFGRLLSLLFCTVVLLIAVGAPLNAQELEPTPTLLPEEIPAAIAPITEGDYDILNFLLLGSDTTHPTNAGRTDVIIVVSVNQTAGTVSLLSIPRDLYVYIPEIGMNRINTAYGLGEQQLGTGQGPQSLINTLEYNLGLEIDYYARINFTNFRQIIDDLGGLDIAVDCAIEDWRLIEPDMDPTLEENWAMFTLPVGFRHMDGDLALWYARSRRTSSDLDRGRRQQALLRAVLSRIRNLSMLDQVTDVWPQLMEIVETNISLDVMLGLIPVGAALDSTAIASYTFRANQEVRGWTSPQGASVLLPDRAAITALERQMYQPPTTYRLTASSPRVQVINGSGIAGMDRVAASRLEWEGFLVSVGEPLAAYSPRTSVVDYTGQVKGGSLMLLQNVLRLGDEDVLPDPVAAREFDYRVVVGGDYFPCTYNVVQPSSS
ncbi:MAG: LCP family protein [Anaerolineae bacterium]|nr:LCP family protein [Anaerolineae bacterium]